MRLAEKAKPRREKLIAEARSDIAASVGPDQLIVQAVQAGVDCDRAAHLLRRRLREWHGYYHPELDVRNVEKYVELVISGEDRQKDTMGGDLSVKDLVAIRSYAKSIKALQDQKGVLASYVEDMMGGLCPNVLALAGAAVGGKLLAQAGSLRRLALMPASTIQMLGAEKALFRHLTKGSRPPKHGVLIQHPFVGGARKDQQGKRARALADKLSIAARVDFFKGRPIAKRLLEELEARFP